jgi:isoleucyl-tRNA synthetase
VANEGKLTVALDITVTPDLRNEGIAREFVNRIQNMRKESGYDVTDKIHVDTSVKIIFNDAVLKHKDYIRSQTLAKSIELD